MHEQRIVDGSLRLQRHGIEPDDPRQQALRYGTAVEAASIAMFTEWLGQRR
jgi:hypothetical protein